jgi:hypothetical protein
LIHLIPPFHNLKRAKIEPLIIPQEKLEELKTLIQDPKLADIRKSVMMRQISGTCMVCGKMPSQIAKYRMYGATVIEKYCNECLCLAREWNE